MKRGRYSRRGGLASVGLALVLCAMPAAAQSTISTQQNPTQAFSTPGLKSVTLQACNEKGCTTVTKTVLVLDPRPSVTSAVAFPLIAEVGQLVHLTGAGTGQPALSLQMEGPRRPQRGRQSSAEPRPGGTRRACRRVSTPRSCEIQNASGIAVSLPRLITVVPSTGLDFYTIFPCRVFDSRSGPALSNGVPRLFDVVGSGCGIPAGARAVALNVTVVGATGSGHVCSLPGQLPAAVQQHYQLCGWCDPRQRRHSADRDRRHRDDGSRGVRLRRRHHRRDRRRERLFPAAPIDLRLRPAPGP